MNLKELFLEDIPVLLQFHAKIYNPQESSSKPEEETSWLDKVIDSASSLVGDRAKLELEGELDGREWGIPGGVTGKLEVGGKVTVGGQVNPGDRPQQDQAIVDLVNATYEYREHQEAEKDKRQKQKAIVKQDCHSLTPKSNMASRRGRGGQ